MNPARLFPVLCIVFGAAALWQWSRTGRLRGAAGTWLTLAALFGAVSIWLQLFR